MDFRPSEEQVLLRDMVRRFLADAIPAPEAGKAPLPVDDWRAMGELGVLGIALPAAAGGMDGAPQDAAIVAKELGRAVAVTPFAEAMLGAADLLARHGTTDQIDQRIVPAAEGTQRLAWAEGSVTDSDGSLDGTCPLVRWGADADAFVIVDSGRAWLVAGDAPGLDRHPSRLADGSVAATLSLHRCSATALAVTDDDIIRARALAQLGYVAEMVGIMATLLDQTVDYARQRRQFGVAIGTFQVVQHKLARMFVRLEQSRSLLLKAAATARDASDFVRHVTAAKAYVAEAAQHVAEEAVHLHGGMGVTDELVVGRALRRVMVLARVFGRAEEARHRLAA
ncbi:acyl-CoA/acyl-ACP dehydrogenase [Sphingomonadaceae bacterium OTU29LAMAA1]|nr:acyl-CoA/acyl-ACP dehydrogenase [Sphingomonadaceae bacterium OTU29LAMAA1]